MFDFFSPRRYYICPICGAVLDSDDDFVMIDSAGCAANPADVVGCSRCLKKVKAERMEEVYGSDCLS